MADPDLDELAQATGLALALVGSLLEGAEVIPRGEFRRHLANLATLTLETHQAQGELLQRWAALAERVESFRTN